MKFGDGPASKNKLAILKKKMYPLIYKTNRNKLNSLHDGFLYYLNFWILFQ